MADVYLRKEDKTEKYIRILMRLCLVSIKPARFWRSPLFFWSKRAYLAGKKERNRVSYITVRYENDK